MRDTLTQVRHRLTGPRAGRSVSGVEYGLLVALVAVLIVGGVSLLGPQVAALVEHTASAAADRLLPPT